MSCSPVPRQRRLPVQLGLETLEDRSLPSTISAASSTAVFAIRPDQSVWANVAPSGWFPIATSGFAVSISAVQDIVGSFAVFALTPASTVYGYRAQTGWFFVGGTFDSISAGLDQVGAADVFAHTAGGSLFEFNRLGTFHLGDFVKSMAASNNDVVVAVLANNAVWAHSAALGWLALSSPGFAQSVSIYPDSTGTQVVFALTPGNTLFTYTFQSGWSPLGSFFTTVSAGRDLSGNVVAFTLTTSNGLWEFSPAQGNATRLGSFVTAFSGADSDRVFAVLNDGSVWAHDTRFGWFNYAGPGFVIH